MNIKTFFTLLFLTLCSRVFAQQGSFSVKEIWLGEITEQDGEAALQCNVVVEIKNLQFRDLYVALVPLDANGRTYKDSNGDAINLNKTLELDKPFISGTLSFNYPFSMIPDDGLRLQCIALDVENEPELLCKTKPVTYTISELTSHIKKQQLATAFDFLGGLFGDDSDSGGSSMMTYGTCKKCNGSGKCTYCNGNYETYNCSCGDGTCNFCRGTGRMLQRM